MYSTQMDAARRGIVTDEMRAVAVTEGMEIGKLISLMAEGKIVIPANKRHLSLKARGIGRAISTKINVNLGTSRDCPEQDSEMEKVRAALAMGADAIMDLSSNGDTGAFRRALIAESPVMVGTVPIYDTVIRCDKPLREISADEWLETVRIHAEDGVDFQTIHCGLTRAAAARYKGRERLTGIVSRGGSLIFAWMEMTGQENPFYERFDEVLDICAEHDVTLSLGDACRPGSIADSSDACQLEELIVLGDLTRRAWEKNVQVIIEGPGHMSLDEIEANMLLQRKICGDAPFYVLGPLVTDIAPGYDHITAAIGGTVAAKAGASFLCYVTPAEHLRLPTLDDMKEGIVASRIAAHAGDVARGIPGARERDRRMSEARKNLDWEGMFAEAIDPDKARRYREESPPEEADSCSMCGKMCAVRNMNEVMEGRDIDVRY